MLISGADLFAQTSNELWTKINVTKTINQHLSLGMDLQHRRQNGMGKETKNPLEYQLLNGARLWIYYKLNNDWKLTVSPIALFENHTFINTSPGKKQSYELRAMMGTFKDYPFGNLKNSNRLLYELSSIQFNTANKYLRHRYRLQTGFLFLIKKPGKKTSLNYYLVNELIYKTQKGLAAFDQNRFYNGIKWTGSYYDANIGYQLTYQKMEPGYSGKNQLLVTLNLNL